MPGYVDVSNPRYFPLAPSNESLTGFAAAVSGASWTLTATSVPDGLAHQVSVQNATANSKSGINITIVGTDQNGNAQSETITGPGASATVESTLYYKTLTSVTPASTWGADTANIGWVDEIATVTIPVNVLAEDVLTLAIDVSGTINFTVQQTFDTINGPDAVTPRWQTIPGGGTQTSDGLIQTTGGATGVQILINSYSSGATLKLNANPTNAGNANTGSANQPFAIGGRTDTLGATASTGRVLIRDIAGNRQVTVSSPAAGQVTMIKFGDSSVTAVVADDTPILPGTVQVFTVPIGATHMAGITVSSTATLYVTPGNGY